MDVRELELYLQDVLAETFSAAWPESLRDDTTAIESVYNAGGHTSLAARHCSAVCRRIAAHVDDLIAARGQ